MAKLIDLNRGGSQAIGAEALLRFIDDINVIRARSGNRYRFEPKANKDSGILEMREFFAVPRPVRPDTPSPRFAGHTWVAAE
jgi:hypothetical protein